MPDKDQRATLEAKDRDELMTIATTLGGKPGSRAKKADIIEVILGLIAEAEPAAPKPRRARTPKAAAADEATGDAVPDQAAGAEDAGRGDARTDDRSATSGEAVAPSEDGSSGDRARDEGADGESASPTSRPTGDAESSTSDGSDVAGDGESEVEGGGRRRRRRGRDRGGERSAERSPERGGERGGDRGGERSADRGTERFADRSDEPWAGEPVEVSGVLDLRDEGYGFIRVNGYLPSREDVYVSVKQTRQFSLRRGDFIIGASRPAARNEKNPALLRVDTVNGGHPDAARDRRRFDDLTPLFPDERLALSSRDEPYNMTSRIVDLLAPIGKGQRGLIVSPPKAGKTTIMKQIAKSIEENNPEVHLMVLLVDERPEEVTDMRRSVSGEVVASTFDRPAEEHTAVAELVLERAKRMVEEGRDVVIVLDGITRLARAYNLAAPATGRVMSGGIDTGALYPPKRFFGAARNLEEGGSLTILASALVETGSKMDEVIFEEFKGTGNLELRLDRRLAERRLYPAINVDASSTRHEELLFDPKQLQQVYRLRRVLSGLAEGGSSAPGLEMLIDRLGTFRTNDEFLAEIAKG